MRNLAQNGDAGNIGAIRQLLGQKYGVRIPLGICEVAGNVAMA